MRKFYVFLILVPALSLITGCTREKPPQSKEAVYSVIAKSVNKGAVDEILFYVGDIKAKDDVNVYPKVSGKLIENLVKENAKVKRGIIIAYIDRDEIGFEFQRAPVVSPIDGTVGKVYLDKGASVTAQTAIARIVNIDQVRVKLNVTEIDLPKIKERETTLIELDAYPQEIFKGYVDRVSPVVDLASRTAIVEIRIDNPDYRLKPGMFAKIKIIVSTKENTLIIPRDAILREDSQNYCFVVKENIARKIKINLGLEENNTIEVLDGLSEGDLVITFGQENLKDGSIVKLSEPTKE